MLILGYRSTIKYKEKSYMYTQSTQKLYIKGPNNLNLLLEISFKIKIKLLKLINKLLQY